LTPAFVGLRIVFLVEEKNMRLSLRSLVLGSAAFCATAAFAANQARVDVPFSFTMKGQSYPAGTYDLAMNPNHTTVTMASKADRGKQIQWNVQPTEAAATAAVVTFDQTGTNHELKTIQLGDKVTPALEGRPANGVSASVSVGGQ
jgi:hypothetical protein